jgi:hypothetical protein
MNEKFYPLVSIFMDAVLHKRKFTMNEVMQILCRRYGLTPDAAKGLIMDAMQSRWFSINTQGSKFKITSLTLRGPVHDDLIHSTIRIMSDGIWRQPETLAEMLHTRTYSAADACLLLERVGLFDSRFEWPGHLLYAKINGAQPTLYSPDFTLS